MNWQIAIDANREKLLSIIITLMSSLGLVKGGMLTTLPFYLHRKALLILRPAEAAVRRLIMMAAYELELRGFNLARLRERGLAKRGGEGVSRAEYKENTGAHGISFRLIDPLKAFTEEAPDYTEFGPSFDEEYGSSDRTPTPATSLGRRLLALKHALDNINKQARRLTRWYAIRDEALKQNHPHRLSPIRPGFPPGYRRKPQHPIEEVLLDCHSLAQYARERRDSS
ncbi:MAG: hypothetical protein ACRCU5_13510 [Rhizobiaceae bacterium]